MRGSRWIPILLLILPRYRTSGESTQSQTAAHSKPRRDRQAARAGISASRETDTGTSLPKNCNNTCTRPPPSRRVTATTASTMRSGTS